MVFCDRCDRYFPHEKAYNQHRADHNAHWMCWSCDRDFFSFRAREQHWMNSSLHEYCTICEEPFDDDEEFLDHLEEYHFTCRMCGGQVVSILFKSNDLLSDLVAFFQYFNDQYSLDTHL